MRCFVEHDGTGWKAYCVDVDLAGVGNTWMEARAALDTLLERYCYDLDEGATSARALRRPQLMRKLKYWTARLLGARSPEESVNGACAYTRHCYEFHAPPQLLVGLA